MPDAMTLHSAVMKRVAHAMWEIWFYFQKFNMEQICKKEYTNPNIWHWFLHQMSILADYYDSDSRLSLETL